VSAISINIDKAHVKMAGPKSSRAKEFEEKIVKGMSSLVIVNEALLIPLCRL
jgi:hypothetical protein